MLRGNRFAGALGLKTRSLSGECFSSGVGEHIARSFAETRRANGHMENTFMVLPEQDPNMENYKDKVILQVAISRPFIY